MENLKENIFNEVVNLEKRKRHVRVDVIVGDKGIEYMADVDGMKMLLEPDDFRRWGLEAGRFSAIAGIIGELIEGRLM